MSEWIAHTGNENPVPGKKVIYEMMDEKRRVLEREGEVVNSERLDWSSNIGDCAVISYKIIEEGEMRKFETGATRDANTDKLDYKGFLSMIAVNQFAQYMHKNRKQADGSIRGSDNWKLGIPVPAYEESFTRHVFEWLTALENGDREAAYEIAPAIFFNLQGWMHEMGKIK